MRRIAGSARPAPAVVGCRDPRLPAGQPGPKPNPNPTPADTRKPEAFASTLAEIDRRSATASGIRISRASTGARRSRGPPGSYRDAKDDGQPGRLLRPSPRASAGFAHVPPAGRPDARDATGGRRDFASGEDGGGYAVKGDPSGGSAEGAGMRIGDRILAVRGRKLRASRVNFRDMFFVLEGVPARRSTVDVEPRGTNRPARAPHATAEPSGDASSGRARGSCTAGREVLRIRAHVGRLDGDRPRRSWTCSPIAARPDVHSRSSRAGRHPGIPPGRAGNSGGYDPNILSTFLRGRWSAGDYTRSRPRRTAARPARVQTAPGRAPRQFGDGQLGRGARVEVPPRIRSDRSSGDDGRNVRAGRASRRSRTDRPVVLRADDRGARRACYEGEGRGTSRTSRWPTGLARSDGEEDAIVEAAIRRVAEAGPLTVRRVSAPRARTHCYPRGMTKPDLALHDRCLRAP